MATLAPPGNFDDYSDDEFDGFALDCSEYVEGGHEAADGRRFDRHFVPSTSSLVNKGRETNGDHIKLDTTTGLNTAGDGSAKSATPRPASNLKSPTQQTLSSGGSVKFSLDASSSDFNDSNDAIVTNGNVERSPITSARPIGGGHFGRTSKRTGRFQHDSRFKKGLDSLQNRDNERSKGQLNEAEESENFRIAVQSGNLSQVKRILENGFDPDAILSSGWTALMHACDAANLEMTKLLLDHGANPKKKKDQYSPLMALCAGKTESKGQVETARLLINRGAVVNSHDRHKMSPLIYACGGSHLELAELLISVNADVNKQDSRGWTPLHYAASRGNIKLVKLLIESGANPELQCNLGDTPASVAYSNNHTELRDWLDRVTSSPKGASSLESPLPPHPLFSDVLQRDTNNEELHKPPSSDVMMTSSTPSGRDIQYGDLELFLEGEQLRRLIPLFKEHHVEFKTLLSMTDKDLEQMGISEVGTRKKILTGVAEVHKREWDMPSSALPHDKALSAMEAAVILSNLARHSSYIKATTSYLLAHVRTDADMIGPHLLSDDIEKLNSDLSGAVTAVSSLHDEVLSLEIEVQRALSQATPTSTDSIPVRRRRGLLMMKVIGGAALVTCVAYITGKTLFKYLSS